MNGRPPAGPVPHLVVDDVEEPVLDAASSHHLRRVRRKRRDDRCTVTDGRGRWRWCRLTGDDELAPDGAVQHVDRSGPAVRVAMALTKGDRPAWATQKLTELGVDEILFVSTERTVVRWDDVVAVERLARLRGVATAALEQSGGCWLPVVGGVATVDDLAERGAVRLDRDAPALTGHVELVAVGPEGGWTETEAERLRTTASLGPNVLRSETAALTAGALLCSFRSAGARRSGPPVTEAPESS